MKKEEIGISETASENKKRRGRPTVYQRDHKMCYAALKLIEQLYKDGHIPVYMYRNILNDYAEIVDLSKFTVAKEENECTK